ncbi:nucleotidyltransferase family protein [Thioclava pacifica]|uniref:Nucleotidyltransferase family protein n=1 Tax=Thioclava pacifica DSM 10166 TaxID=1353537 RepID=A0A074J2S7_9RHOB|nr:nucleotidyltransferase family protein [Thioclava pacifica]KEO50824.1 hypothetical protein TP2_14445 [Thioclava pacifica DSM 10166]
MLSVCASPEHRAALGLLSVALGAGVGDQLIEDISASDPVKLAAIINVGHVHTLLSITRSRDPRLDEVLPADLWLYLDEMHKANLDRQSDAVAQLREIGVLLHENGLSAVVLKGAAELLSPVYPLPGQRFLSDLDILVREDEAEQVRSLLQGRGGDWRDYPETTAKISHHLPPIANARWGHLVELHLRVGQAPVDHILEAARVFDRSLPSDIPGLRVPSLQDRFLHHVLHGMQRRFARHEIYLRDISDHAAFARALSSQEDAGVKQALTDAGLLGQLEALDALLCLLVPEEFPAPGKAGQDWVRKALKYYGSPELRKHRDTLDWVIHYARKFFFDAEFRRHYIRKVSSAEGRREFVAFHRERLNRIR